MIDKIKSYFKAIAKQVDSELKYDGLQFDTELTADHNLDFTYKLNVGAASINRQDTHFISVFPVTMVIYKVSNIDNQDLDFDDAYCKAIDIATLAMDLTKVDQDDYLKSVEASSVTPDPLIDNDNTMQFTIQFSATVIFKNINGN
jgi:hypothetical protein